MAERGCSSAGRRCVLSVLLVALLAIRAEGKRVHLREEVAPPDKSGPGPAQGPMPMGSKMLEDDDEFYADDDDGYADAPGPGPALGPMPGGEPKPERRPSEHKMLEYDEEEYDKEYDCDDGLYVDAPGPAPFEHKLRRDDDDDDSDANASRSGPARGPMPERRPDSIKMCGDADDDDDDDSYADAPELSDADVDAPMPDTKPEPELREADDTSGLTATSGDGERVDSDPPCDSCGEEVEQLTGDDENTEDENTEDENTEDENMDEETTCGSCSCSMIDQAVEATNSYRSSGSLSCDDDLSAMAQAHSEDMCSRNSLDHEGYEDRCSGYCAENVIFTNSFTTDSGNEATAGWYASEDGHKENMMNDIYDVVGFGYVVCESDDKVYWTGIYKAS